MPDFGIFRGFNNKLFGDKLFAGQLPINLGKIGALDTDSIAFFDRVIAAGGSLSLLEQYAVNQLVLDMKSYSIWDKMKAIYPMVGASAAACAQNLKSSSFTGTFNGGITYASTGVKPNGTTGYMNTNLNMANQFSTINSVHLSYYSRTNISANDVEMGVYGTTTGAYLLYTYSGSSFKSLNRAQSVGGSNYTPTTGLLIGNRNSSTQEKYYHNGTLVDTINVASSGNLNNLNIFLMGYNVNGAAAELSQKESAYASIGDGLTDTEASNLYTAVQAFQTTLSRQV